VFVQTPEKNLDELAKKRLKRREASVSVASTGGAKASSCPVSPRGGAPYMIFFVCSFNV
jgi:hypothetical protein